jgi:cbb3-type cytochrome oxidase subunit 3
VVHFIFLYVLWFKIKEEELTDLPMRNLEYGLYVIFFFYGYKFYQSIRVLGSFEDFENHLLPEGFMTIQITIATLYFLLLALTLLVFLFRKKRVGDYNFEEANKIDSWD